MTAVGKFIEGALQAVEDAAGAAFHTFEALGEGIIKTAEGLVDAIKHGDLARVAEHVAELAGEMLQLANPEMVAATAAMTAAFTMVGEAAKAVGIDEEPWMKKLLAVGQAASSCTSKAGTIMAVSLEIAQTAAGQKGQIQTAWDIITDYNNVNANQIDVSTAVPGLGPAMGKVKAATNNSPG